jgi:hypothetical protein
MKHHEKEQEQESMKVSRSPPGKKTQRKDLIQGIDPGHLKKEGTP